jgi:hypothetical protein
VVVASGTLSTNNCPATFNITESNVTVSSSASSLAKLIYSSLYSPAEQATLQASFTSGNSSAVSSYVTSTTVLAPFAVIGAAFALTFGIALCCCVF